MRKLPNSFSPNGFTLTEVLVVIAIIAVLVVIAVGSLNPITQMRKSRDSRRKSDLSQYRAALEAYAAAHDGVYPIHAGGYFRADTDPDPVEVDLCEDLTGAIAFIDSCPSDPKTTDTDEAGIPLEYFYRSDALGYEMVLYANLEIGDFWAICGGGKTGEVAAVADILTFCSI